MEIKIKGIRLGNLYLKSDEHGKPHEIESASYSLVSELDKVIAKQSIGCFDSQIRVEPSAATKNAVTALIASYAKDIQEVTGLSACDVL